MRRPPHRADCGAIDASDLVKNMLKRLGVRIEAGFDHMLPVIGALAKDPARGGDRREKFERVERNRRGLRAPPVVFAVLNQRRRGWVIIDEGHDASAAHHAPARTGRGRKADQIYAIVFAFLLI